MRAVRVAVIGAGLGGLCLAQGLRGAGVDVVVYERDTALAARRQGYRLHLDDRAGEALHACLPPELFALFLSTCGRPGRAFTVLDRRLRVLHRAAGDPNRDPDGPRTLSTSANRLTLREVLAAGLDGRIRFGHEFVRYTDHGDTVTAHFADGTRAEADVLVGADGVNSPVRRQRLPHAEIVDTGTRCVYGRTPLDERALSLVPAAMHDGFTAIVGRRVGVAAGLVRFRERPEEAAARLAPSVALSPAGDYLMWAVSAQRDRFPMPDHRLSEVDPAGLHGLAGGMLRSWHPDLRALLAAAAVEETFLVRVRASVPVPAWEPGRITLLGDAIHAMSPARGSGANTALRDAALLARLLAAAAGAGADTPVPAIGEYEAAMRDYGFAAVRASRDAERGLAARGVEALGTTTGGTTARGTTARGTTADGTTARGTATERRFGGPLRRLLGRRPGPRPDAGTGPDPKL